MLPQGADGRTYPNLQAEILFRSEMLLQFFDILPADGLRVFRSSAPISLPVLHVLLRSQQSLKSLSFTLEGVAETSPAPEFDLVLNDTHALNTLSHLEELVAIIPGCSKSWCQSHGRLISNASSLRKLKISGERPDSNLLAVADSPLAPLSMQYRPVKLSRLTDLSLVHLLADSAILYLGFIDFSCLKTLSIDWCTEIPTLSQGLVNVLLQDGCNLDALSLDFVSDGRLYDASPLLLCCSGLSKIGGSLIRLGNTDPHTIDNHQSSLRHLNCSLGTHLKYDRTVAFLAAGPELEYLCVKLDWIKLYENWDKFAIRKDTAFEVALVSMLD
jgi:hypothetical protein